MTVRVGPSSTLGVLLRSLLALWLAVSPVFWATPASPAAVPVMPAGPVEENESEERESGEVRTAVEWAAPTRAERRQTESAPPYLAILPLPLRPALPSNHLSSSAPADPFHNGLGSPYLC